MNINVLFLDSKLVLTVLFLVLKGYEVNSVIQEVTATAVKSASNSEEIQVKIDEVSESMLKVAQETQVQSELVHVLNGTIHRFTI